MGPQPTNAVSLDSTAAAHAVEVSPRIWWVGAVLPGDPFQCHAFLVEAGDQSVLIDPGSTLTIEATLAKVEEVVPLDAIRTIIIHHADPDISDGMHVVDDRLRRPDVRILTEWRSALLLRHLAVRFPLETIEDHHWRLDLGEHRELHFALTPYLHFPGAFTTFDPTTRTLFSSDLFGGFNRAHRLWATNAGDFEDLRQFHEHYMPSRDILIAGLGTIVNQFAPIDCVCPQHGYLIPRHLVAPMFEQLSRLECGIMLASKSDTHLARLLAVAGALRRVEDILEDTEPLNAMLRRIEGELRTLMPLEALWAEVRTQEADPARLLRFDSEHPDGLELDHWTTEDQTHVVLPVTDRHSSLTIAVVLHTTEPFSIISELPTMLSLVATRVHQVVGVALERRDTSSRELTLRTAANNDPLTGLLNRRALDEWTSGHPSRAGVLMLDIDHFKAINDSYGHQVGDLALKAVADVVVRSLRRDDRAFRYGGEEFVVIVSLDSDGSEDEALMLAERLRANIANLDATALGIATPITVSVGVDTMPGGDELASHIARADTALYTAKHRGRNRVVGHRSADANEAPPAEPDRASMEPGETWS